MGASAVVPSPGGSVDAVLSVCLHKQIASVNFGSRCGMLAGVRWHVFRRFFRLRFWNVCDSKGKILCETV